MSELQAERVVTDEDIIIVSYLMWAYCLGWYISSGRFIALFSLVSWLGMIFYYIVKFKVYMALGKIVYQVFGFDILKYRKGHKSQ